MSIALNWVYDFACVYSVFVPCEPSIMCSNIERKSKLFNPSERQRLLLTVLFWKAIMFS